VTGVLRTESKKVPFSLTMRDNTVRWEFTDPPQTLVLRLGETSSQLEEVTADGKRKVAAARLDDRVRGSDVTYADLAMNFLYWPEATVEGEQTIATTKCWQVLCLPPAKSDSPYGKVRVWVAKGNGAMLKAEMYNREGKLARSFLVIDGQKTGDGLWMLKSMRILATGARSPSYLDIDSRTEPILKIPISSGESGHPARRFVGRGSRVSPWLCWWCFQASPWPC